MFNFPFGKKSPGHGVQRFQNMIALGMFLVFGGLPTRVNAQQTVLWINPLEDQYNNGSNWDTGTVPQANDDIEFFRNSYSVLFSSGNYQTNRISGTGRDEQENLPVHITFRPNSFLDSVVFQTNNLSLTGGSSSGGSSLTLGGGILPGGFQMNVSDRVSFHGSSLAIDSGAGISANIFTGRTITLRNGGRLTGNILFADFIDVSGPSTATVNSELVFGGVDNFFGTNGDMSILNGGQVNSDGAVLSKIANSTSNVNIAGGASNWNSSLGFVVGGLGAADLTIDGGSVDSNGGHIAKFQGSTANVLIDNNGRWNANNRLDIGGDVSGVGGTAIVRLTNGGSLSATDTVIWDNSELHLDGGSLTTQTLDARGQFHFNSGTLNFSSTTSRFVVRDGTQVFDSNRRLSNLGQTLVQSNATVRIDDDASAFTSSSVINNGRIDVNGNGVMLGNDSRHDGYSGIGVLNIGSNQVNLRDAGLADLGRLTILSGGEITASHGVSLGTGNVLTGNGTVTTRVAGGLGSAIYASGGDLTLGDASSVVGFATAGDIYTSINTIRLKDANQVQLGSLTQMGEDSFAGRLEAISGGVVDFGENITGFGIVDSTNDLQSAFIVNGAALGDRVGEELTFEGYVKGVGTFDNVIFNGTFAPGLSPGEIHGGNMRMGSASTLEMELGGLIRGTEFDAIIASGSLTLDGTLDVQLLGGFSPTVGNSFDILDWSTVTGSFDNFLLPILNNGLFWDTSQIYSTGTLRVSAVPEPASCCVVLGLALGFGLRRRRKTVSVRRC